MAGQIGLARHESPHRARILLGFAHDLHTDLPHTRTALLDGRLSEYRAILVASETGCLQSEDRADIDQAVCGDTTQLNGQLNGRLNEMGTGDQCRWRSTSARSASSSLPPDARSRCAYGEGAEVMDGPRG